MIDVLLITGIGGPIQGLGSYAAIEQIKNSLESQNKNADVAFINSLDELDGVLTKKNYDLVWSSLYHVSSDSSAVWSGFNGTTVFDFLDRKGVPYVGPNNKSLLRMIDKNATHRHLEENGVPVPENYLLEKGDSIPQMSFPVFVKPRSEANSNGIDEKSVVHSESELKKRVAYVADNFNQGAIVEEFLPGAEYTVLRIGNGSSADYFPVLNVIDKRAYDKYPILFNATKEDGLVKMVALNENDMKRNIEVADAAFNALGCCDYNRIDLKEDLYGDLKVIDANGIPGLTPNKSRTREIFELYHPHLNKNDSFTKLTNDVVNSAMLRYYG